MIYLYKAFKNDISFSYLSNKYLLYSVYFYFKSVTTQSPKIFIVLRIVQGLLLMVDTIFLFLHCMSSCGLFFFSRAQFLEIVHSLAQ